MNKLIYDGWIEVICGPMFAGKTDKLLNRLDKVKYAKEKFIVFKPIIDTRTIGSLSSRFNKKTISAIDISSSKDIISFLDNSIEKYKVIAIDEVQFLDYDIVNVCIKLSHKGYHIILSGLDKNFKGEPFSNAISGLLAIADKVTKISACCHICGAQATFSQLITKHNSENIKDNILIGDSDFYEARCYQHFEYNKN